MLFARRWAGHAINHKQTNKQNNQQTKQHKQNNKQPNKQNIKQLNTHTKSKRRSHSATRIRSFAPCKSEGWGRSGGCKRDRDRDRVRDRDSTPRRRRRQQRGDDRGEAEAGEEPGGVGAVPCCRMRWSSIVQCDGHRCVEAECDGYRCVEAECDGYRWLCAFRPPFLAQAIFERRCFKQLDFSLFFAKVIKNKV